VDNEARRVLAELPIDTQESLWDLFEELAANPTGEKKMVGTRSAVHDHCISDGSQTLHVLFAVVIDDGRQLMSIPLIEWIFE
jgi:hypothetical protein